jgi:hypothetical protein
MDKLIENLQSSLGQAIPGVAGALVILLVGWIVAFVVRVGLKKGLKLFKINDRMNARSEGTALNLESGIATAGYYVVLLFTLLTVFNQLGLEIASQPIQALFVQVFDFIPKLIGGGVLILIAWISARIISQLVQGAIAATPLDQKIKSPGKPVSESLGLIAYWLVFLLFLPAILGVFKLEGLLIPAQSMIEKIVGMVPNVIGAAIIIGVGWVISTILRDLSTNVLAVAGFDKLGEKVGIKGKTKLSSVAGLTVFYLIFIPSIIAGLNTLQIAAIADPATQMLASFLAFIPNLLGAVAIIVITYLVAKPVSGFVSKLLSAAGFDSIPQKLGFHVTHPKGAALSKITGNLVLLFMMLFAATEAANLLAFTQLSRIVATLILFGGQILLGSVIIGLGLWISNIVSQNMTKASSNGHPVAALVRVIILGLVFSMGLRAMGLANDIVNMAFGLTLGAAAVAFALSFGLGGRAAAGRQMEYWFSNLRRTPKGKSEPDSHRIKEFTHK